ncbi:MAG: hypothetical protein WC942_04915 [Clostridia bacterium]
MSKSYLQVEATQFTGKEAGVRTDEFGAHILDCDGYFAVIEVGDWILKSPFIRTTILSDEEYQKCVIRVQ